MRAPVTGPFAPGTNQGYMIQDGCCQHGRRWEALAGRPTPYPVQDGLQDTHCLDCWTHPKAPLVLDINLTSGIRNQSSPVSSCPAWAKRIGEPPYKETALSLVNMRRYKHVQISENLESLPRGSGLTGSWGPSFKLPPHHQMSSLSSFRFHRLAKLSLSQKEWTVPKLRSLLHV